MSHTLISETLTAASRGEVEDGKLGKGGDGSFFPDGQVHVHGPTQWG